ncbi:Methyltransferase-like protein 7A [Fulvia fulva]|uniref:Methyltransferase-like protein 7A n=1 Tax=Passalora fulva TaxID=5499 RepID=A0A9Q8LAK3_PASFU|nr:Methyltransferase-like protein 7A [Fulvia fulva]KAK4631952.1 Methyltransferase-like protein 7A [Fulvia fulva]KAK4632880.1 Methyltransferase-like protein 7A [Fulvia fulva]UJO13825.1 Methyltransferase-like protein 7A [Fulvia fulva]WPV11449.1 Methyltransferase-like protein 7A [Fulvia fulva]WPV25621.1 Methyltransferase-like protein 7A [Fulvia fulva]
MPPKTVDQPSGPLNLLRPFLLLSYSAYYIVPTIISLIRELNLKPFFSLDAFKDEWFGRFWIWFGPASREYAAPAVMPLLQNSASGVCLDIGPGTGQWLYLFARAENPSITKIYGVEPNHAMHKSLWANAVKAGLGDVYEVIGCGAEELGTKGGIDPGSVDTIVTVQCLCSIPTPELIIRELYPLLKPGGKWLVYEHVKTKYTGDFVAYWQKMINIIWPHFFNGCDITRPTDEWLLRAGEWEEVKLKPGAGEGPYDCVPHVIGTLTKKKG